jgi:tetratricopeptide (TPR) repeat protein
MTLLTKRGRVQHLNEMGLALMDQNKMADAFEQFEAAVTMAPTYGPCHLNMSVICAKQGRYEEALVHCKNALKFMPQDVVVHRNMGKLLDILGRNADSLRQNEMALALAPNDASLAKKISLQSVGRGNLPQAHIHYDQYRQKSGQKFHLKL